MRLLLLFAATASALDGDGFHSLSLFVGQQGERDAVQGQPPDRTCKRFASCDTPGSWHAQALQDRCVAQAIFPGKRDGYFVDLAANHPILKSNTRTLERDFGWRGLCIEGNEEFIMLLLKRRRCQVVGAIVSSDADAVVQYRHWVGSGGGGSTGTWQHALSGIVGFDNAKNATSARKSSKNAGFRDVESVTTRLEDVLRRHNAPTTIDYLSLDVEGAEETVLRRFPFGSYTFLSLSIERPSKALQEIVASNGYVLVADLPGNFGEKLYVHQSLPGGATQAGERVKALLQQRESEAQSKLASKTKKRQG